MDPRIILLISRIVFNGFILLSGIGVMIFCLFHLAESGQDTEASIAHVGKIAGSPHLVAFFIAFAMIALSAWDGSRLMNSQDPGHREARKRVAGLGNQATALGRRIAQMMKKNRRE